MTEPTCRCCGCTWECACHDDQRGACSWAEPDLCSHCKDSLDIFTQLVTNSGDRVQISAPDAVVGSIELPIHHAEQLLKITRHLTSAALRETGSAPESVSGEVGQ